ncbi:MAG: acylneuraminate cytidylyltransferase [Bacteroidetes bacterium B1(2017)]|nr:MAG: acylneuraminate cytidylyltransferase [Bacteroidetes bacterium B1(2017)]
MKVLAIIPGRGGSKGVKGKNIRKIDGLPLIAYAINSANESKKLSRFIVNTDSDEIEQVARDYKADVYRRLPELGSDSASIVPVILETLEALEKEGEVYDMVMLLQITSPIRTGKNIDEVIEMFEKDHSLSGVISVVPMHDVHPARMYRLDDSNLMLPLNQEWETSRRQDIPPVYYRNGCIYATRIDLLKHNKSLMPEGKKGYVMPVEWLANIDDERDLVITEALIKHLRKIDSEYQF